MYLFGPSLCDGYVMGRGLAQARIVLVVCKRLQINKMEEYWPEGLCDERRHRRVGSSVKSRASQFCAVRVDNVHSTRES